MATVSASVTGFADLRLLAIETDVTNLAAIVASLLGYRSGRIFVG